MVLEVVRVFFATVKLTVPVPDPLVVVSVTQVSAEDAVQAHPLPQLTEKLLLPPPCPNCRDAVGDNV